MNLYISRFRNIERDDKEHCIGRLCYSAITQSDPCIVRSFRSLCLSDRVGSNRVRRRSSWARKSIKDVRIVTRNGRRNYRIPIAGLLVVDKDRCALAVQWVSNCVIPLLHNNDCGSAELRGISVVCANCKKLLIDGWTFLLAAANLDETELRFNVTYFDWIRRHNRTIRTNREWQDYTPSRLSHKRISIVISKRRNRLTRKCSYSS